MFFIGISAQATQSEIFNNYIGAAKTNTYKDSIVREVTVKELFEDKYEYIVFLQRDTSCPIGSKITPDIKEFLDKSFQKVKFVLVDYRGMSQIKALEEDIKKNDFRVEVVLDSAQNLARIFNISTTTEMVILDYKYKVRYKGPINTKFSITSAKDNYENSLELVINELIKNSEAPVRELEAPGCFLEYKSDHAIKKIEDIKIKNIRSFLAQKCVVCHQSLEQNIVVLNSLRDFLNKKRTIQYVLEKRIMPPIEIDSKSLPNNIQYSLSNQERKMLLSWISRLSEQYADNLDEPLIKEVENNKYDFEMDLVKDEEVPENGLSYYKSYYTRSPFDEDKYISETRLIPKLPATVHHVIVRILDRMPRSDENPFSLINNHLGGMTLGAYGLVAPNGSSIYLPKDAIIFARVHFAPNGTKHKNSLKFLINFASSEDDKKKVFRSNSILKTDISLKKNEKKKYSYEYVVPQKMKLYSLIPHMHYRGRSIKIKIFKKKSKKEVLALKIDRYFFHNQASYSFKDPISLNKNDRILMEYVYDNTKDNIFNPNFNENVSSGISSSDEMFYLSYSWVAD